MQITKYNFIQFRLSYVVSCQVFMIRYLVMLGRYAL